MFADDLVQLISLDAAKVDAPEGTVPVIDLCQFGKHKLVSESYHLLQTGLIFPRFQLGKGRIAKPFIVKARFVSRLAEQKIREAGGVVKLVA